jgi:hypothetical protein
LWFVVFGLWFVVCGLWFVVYGLWFVVCGLWFVARLDTPKRNNREGAAREWKGNGLNCPDV